MNKTLVINMGLSIVIASLCALYVLMAVDSWVLAFFAYSSSGSIVFLVFTFISVNIDENDESKKP